MDEQTWAVKHIQAENAVMEHGMYMTSMARHLAEGALDEEAGVCVCRRDPPPSRRRDHNSFKQKTMWSRTPACLLACPAAANRRPLPLILSICLCSFLLA